MTTISHRQELEAGKFVIDIDIDIDTDGQNCAYFVR